jgi:hypothetical protein
MQKVGVRVPSAALMKAPPIAGLFSARGPGLQRRLISGYRLRVLSRPLRAADSAVKRSAL